MSTPATQTVAVRTRGIDMFFGEGETKVTALKQADFEANRGELIMLVGPSGCGKTTLLSVIAGTLTPQTGTVEVFGQRLDGLSQEELTTFRRKHLGFVFQSFNLIPTLTVLENVMVPLLIQGAAQDVAVAKARAMLEKVGLKGREDGRPNALSGGQQQRVAIARALSNRPRILLADEPTGALDTKTTDEIMHLMQDLNRQGITVVVITHENEVAGYASRQIHFRDGRIESDSAHPELKRATGPRQAAGGRT